MIDGIFSAITDHLQNTEPQPSIKALITEFTFRKTIAIHATALKRVLRIAVQSIVGKGITPKICYFCALELRYVP